mgnify:CR=1 FL=1
MNLKINKKALSLVELIVVILIISILIAVTSVQYNKFVNNSRIQNTENDLLGWMSDINQYIEDYGPFKVNITELGITTKPEYLSYLYYGDKTKGTSSIGKEACDFASSSPLNILQAYCTNSFVISDPEKDVDFQYIILTTKSQKDQWGQRYKIICDTQSGKIIVISAGTDTVFNISGYKKGEFSDDIILVVNPKE